MIRAAIKGEATILTRISFESKGHWNYPKKYFDIWESELTIRPDDIVENHVYVVENNGDIVGYYSVTELRQDRQLFEMKLEKGFWLEHMFVLSSNIGQGFGTEMFEHLREWCKSHRVNRLFILADPNAKGFYEKMECEYQEDFPSTVANRTTPLFTLDIEPQE
ncbi:MAG: GNAT family N-acetyltransferase [Thermodesulfobacteriota bacterium]